MADKEGIVQLEDKRPSLSVLCVSSWPNRVITKRKRTYSVWMQMGHCLLAEPVYTALIRILMQPSIWVFQLQCSSDHSLLGRDRIALSEDFLGIA